MVSCPARQAMTGKPALSLGACVSQGVLAFLEARLVGTICLPVVQSHPHALRVGKTEFMGTVLRHPRVGLVPLVRTCLQLNALDAFEFDFFFLFFFLVTLKYKSALNNSNTLFYFSSLIGIF